MERDIETEFKKELGEGLIENEPLLKYTTFHLGGKAKYFFRAKNIEELIKATKLAQRWNIPFFILGGGSNLLISDEGFSGLCLKNEARNLSIIKEKSQVIADSGLSLSKLILEAASDDLGGLEFLYGIPGTVGGAIFQNAGSLGASFSDFLVWVTLLDWDGQVKKVPKSWFAFDYRYSKLQTLSKRPVILTCKLQLSTTRKEEILRKIQHYQKIREEKQPKEPSAGSFFKNPKVDKEWAKRYLKLAGIKDSSLFEHIEKTGRIPAGWLLEQVGAKRLKVKAARVSKKHANFLINYKGKAKAKEVRKLADLLKGKVYEKFGIMLEEEVEYLGEGEKFKSLKV